jgi:PAS domain S-box-containing protein
MNEPVQLMLLGDAVEHARIGVLVWNADRRYVAANSRACELLGVSRAQLLGQPVGSTNRSDEARSLIDQVIERAPAQGAIVVGGREISWLVFPTNVAGLDHILGLMWETADLSAP